MLRPKFKIKELRKPPKCVLALVSQERTQIEKYRKGIGPRISIKPGLLHFSQKGPEV